MADMMSAISFESVSKIYPPKKGSTQPPFKAVDAVSLAIQPGDFFGLLGPNGAGKTTLISMLAGLSQPSSGRIMVMGHDVQRDCAQARRALGVVPQELVFDPFFSVREALVFQSGYFGIKNNRAWIDEILENLGLTDKASVNMRQLSGGMKRRVLVGLALVHRPAVLVLDEPTAGVDVALRQSLWQFIAKLNKSGTTVLLTTHYLEEAEALCNQLAMLKNGKILKLASTTDLLKNASGNVLRFKIDSELPNELKGIARVTGRIVQLPAHNAAQIEQYLAQIREAGLTAHDVEIRKADLEDVFLSLMSGSEGTP